MESLHLPDDAIRWVRLALLVLVGLGLLVLRTSRHLLERPFYHGSRSASPGTGNAAWATASCSAGSHSARVFVPCAGPVLAAITVAGATDHIGLRTIGLTLGFAVGTAIPLLAFALV